MRSVVAFFTMIPKVPKMIKKTGRYATHAPAKVEPWVNAKIKPPIALNNAKSIFEYYSPIDLWIVSNISPIWAGISSILFFSK